MLTLTISTLKAALSFPFLLIVNQFSIESKGFEWIWSFILYFFSFYSCFFFSISLSFHWLVFIGAIYLCVSLCRTNIGDSLSSSKSMYKIEGGWERLWSVSRRCGAHTDQKLAIDMVKWFMRKVRYMHACRMNWQKAVHFLFFSIRHRSRSPQSWMYKYLSRTNCYICYICSRLPRIKCWERKTVTDKNHILCYFSLRAEFGIYIYICWWVRFCGESYTHTSSYKSENQNWTGNYLIFCERWTHF